MQQRQIGWLEHGSTIIVLATTGLLPHPGVREGAVIRARQALLRLPEPGRDASARPAPGSVPTNPPS